MSSANSNRTANDRQQEKKTGSSENGGSPGGQQNRGTAHKAATQNGGTAHQAATQNGVDWDRLVDEVFLDVLARDAKLRVDRQKICHLENSNGWSI